jgi:hypothetical protein
MTVRLRVKRHTNGLRFEILVWAATIVIGRRVAAVVVGVAELTARPAAAQELTALEAGAVADTRVGAAVTVVRTGLAHDATTASAARADPFDLVAQPLVAPGVATVAVLLADFPGRAAEPP